MLQRPTRSASSRSSRARKWRRCPGSSRSASTTRRAGGDHPAGTDCRTDGASLSQPPRRTRARPVPAPDARADSGAHARRSAVSGTAAAHGDGGGGIHRRTGRRAAARVRVQTVGTADEAGRSAAARRHDAAGNLRRRGGGDHHCRSRRSRSTASPSRMRRASPCWRTRARISSCTFRPRSTPRCSTTSRWGSTTPRRWSRTRSAGASASTPSTCRCPSGTARSRQTAPSGSGSAM